MEVEEAEVPPYAEPGLHVASFDWPERRGLWPMGGSMARQEPDGPLLPPQTLRSCSQLLSQLTAGKARRVHVERTLFFR